MSILVVCSGCRARFQVSDQYAGKSGPCPKCKALIQIPTPQEQVTIHGPAEFASGGRNAAGQLVAKPIARQEIKVRPAVAVAVGAAVVAVFMLTWAGGTVLQGWLLARGLGLLLVSPPLVLAAYAFLRDDELEPYSGSALYLRTAICAVVYVALWGAFGYAAQQALTGEVWNWLFVAPPFVIIGALTALACLDLDFGSACFHYAFYLLVTIVLRWTAGMGWLWQSAAT
jgi:hypothetical protein